MTFSIIDLIVTLSIMTIGKSIVGIMLSVVFYILLYRMSPC
jgi:hypothetical protein